MTSISKPSKLFLTQTFLDVNEFNKYVACNLFYLDNSIQNNLQNQDWSKPLILKFSNEQFDNLITSGRVIVPDFSSKDDFWNIATEFYQHFTLPTVVFMGDIDTYSIQLQESLLKLIEEPPHNLNLILNAHSSANILPTIQSRCQIITLPKEVIFELLNTVISESVKDQLPSIADFCKEFLSSASDQITFPELKNIERDQIKMWLWQVYVYLDHFYKQSNGSVLIANKIVKIIEALNLNENNLQKKFVLGSLGL